MHSRKCCLSPEEGDCTSHADRWGKSLLGRGPEAGARPVCSRNSKEAGRAGGEREMRLER